MDKKTTSPEYVLWLKEIKEKISHAQIRAALAASRELILFYWDLGESLTHKLKENAWGNKVIDQLSHDLKSEFPGIQGFSRRNLYYIKQFYSFFSEAVAESEIVPRLGAQTGEDIVPQPGAQTIPSIIPWMAGQLPWSHIKIILDKLKSQEAALF